MPPEKDFSKTFPKVYVNNDSETFEVGEVKCAKFEHGIPEETSIDAALVEINEHLEVEHSRKISKNNEELSEISRCKLSATKITDVMSSDFDQSKSVLIYGATTGLSLGKLKVAGCHARFNNYILVTKGVVPAVTFFNQCEIIKTSPGTLIEEGDSGAFVYSFDKNTSELSCLGMIIGGTSYGSAIMTPIGPVLKALGLQTESLFLIELHRKPMASVPGVPQPKAILTPSNVDQTIQPKLAPDITDITKTLKQTGFQCLIPYVVHAYSQLQGKDVLSSDPESEINKYYDKLLIQDQKPVFVITGITGIGKTAASLLLLNRFKNANKATPLAVTNVRELESIRVLPNITFTILVDGLFDHIESLKIINANISSLNKIRRLLYNWSGKNTMIITMQKEVLNFLKNSHTGKDFFQNCFVVDFTNTADINTQEILYHINDMDECCFEFLSSVLLKPGFSFQNVDIPKRFPSGFFRNDFMIQEKIAESFLDVYLEKKKGLFFIKDKRIRNILCQIHIERNAQEFFKRCPLNYLCDFLSHDKTCSIEEAYFEILISRIFDNVKKYPSYSLFEDFVRLCQIQNFQKYLFWNEIGNASLSKTPKTTRALLANHLVECEEEDYSSIIGMLVNDHFILSNYAGMSKDDTSCSSEEKKTPIRSSFMAIACEFDLKKYKMGYKRKTNASFRIPNKLLEYLLTRRYIEDSLVEEIFIRAIEQNFCSEFALHPDAIWTGYTINKRGNTCEKYVIVVRKEKIKETQTKKIPSKYCGLEVWIKDIFDVEAESIAILKEEDKYNLEKDVIIPDSVIDTLLQAHSNITGITASSVMSMNYNSNKRHKIKPTPCIVISCHTKGVIPVGEKPFPTNINGYPVDVRESCPATSAMRHPQIGDSIRSSTDGMREGTLGGFVFIGRKPVYYLTSAHVLVVKMHLNDYLFDVAKTLDTKVLRQVSHEWKECGKLVRGYFGEIGVKRKVTVDAILVSVNSVDHEPRDVFLPQENLMNAGFLEDSKPYFIGRIKDVSSLDKSLNIVKYGRSTSWTKGRIIAINAMRRTRISANGVILRPYRGQIVIKSDQGKFADLGDSGSLVFSVEDYEDPELQCIGLLNSVNEISFEVNITPIRAVLESLKLNENAFVKLDPPFSLKYFNILKETQNMHTDILLNIEEYTRRPEL